MLRTAQLKTCQLIQPPGARTDPLPAPDILKCSVLTNSRAVYWSVLMRFHYAWIFKKYSVGLAQFCLFT